MAKVALPSYDVQTLNGRSGGVGAFTTHFARLLREQGDDVTIIVTRAETQGVSVDRRWRENYRAWGIDLVQIHNTPSAPNRWPDVWTMRLSEQLAPLLRGFDVVYFGDWANVGFHTLRTKRFTTVAMPSCVTILHGPSGWVRWAGGQHPAIPDDLNMEFIERYGARHSDEVIAPSRHILEWVRRDGWTFAREPEVLGLPYRPEGPDRPPREAGALTRLVYFGRLEKRKGYELFAEALKHVRAATPDVLRRLQEIVLLGHEDVPGAARWFRDELEGAGVPVVHIDGFDSLQARDYLADRAGDTLVVIPSPVENFPYAVIETSLVPGLNVICTRGGGTPEIFGGRGEAQLFDPLPRALAAKIVERLAAPLPSDQLASYDFAAGNRRWLEFHRRLCENAGARRPAPTRRTARTSPAVDICVTYYDKGRHFPQLCESLERQTTQDFRVIAIDDGSPDPHAREVFDALAERYRARGWIFARQPNAFVDAARNEAARRAQAEYVLMVDADDVLVPKAIERLLEAARSSGDDCLAPASYLFAGDAFPYDAETGDITAPPFAFYMPLGASVTAGLVDPAVFGGSVVLIRREVFEAVGGYREVRGAAHEDWELHARLALGGYATDVVPEYLHLYRQTDDGLSRRSDEALAKRRMIDAYDRHLAEAGLPGGGSAFYGLYRECQRLRERARTLERQLNAGSVRFRLFGSGIASGDLSDLQRYPADGAGSPLVRKLRGAYRRTVPLETRLRLGARLAKLLGRPSQP